jgi:hypothetical protein
VPGAMLGVAGVTVMDTRSADGAVICSGLHPAAKSNAPQQRRTHGRCIRFIIWRAKVRASSNFRFTYIVSRE